MSAREKKIHKSVSIQFTSIKTPLTIMCIVFAIVPLVVVSFFTMQISKKALGNTSSQLSTQILNQTGINVTTYTGQTEETLNKLVISDIMGEGLFASMYSPDAMEKMQAEKAIEEKIINQASLDSSLKNITLVFPDNYIVGNLTSVEDDEFAGLESMKLSEGYHWIKGFGSDTEGIYVLKSVTGSGSGADQTAYLVVEMNTEGLYSVLDKIELLDNSSLSLMQGADVQIYGTSKKMETYSKPVWKKITGKEQAGSFSDADNLYTFYNIDNGWTLVSRIPLASLTSQLNGSLILVVFLILGAAVIAVVVSGLFARGFARPIITLMNLMKEAEKGNLTVRAKVRGRNEITNLCISFNHMFDKLSKLLTQTREVVDQTLEDSAHLSAAASRSLDSFGQLTMSISEIAEGSNSQAEYAGDSSYAMLHLSDEISHILETNSNIAKKSQGAQSIIDHASQNVETLNSSMESSLSMIAQIRVSMEELNECNGNVEELMKLMDSISEETNLLSLNASIEAARAGEFGRGFSVVAQEVRHLSEQSRGSTGIVRENLNKMAHKIGETFQLIQDSAQIFERQEQAVRNADSSFSEIVTLLKEVDQELGAISSKIKDVEKLQSTTSEKIVDIAAITQESAAAATQVTQLSQDQLKVMDELSGLSEHLAELMSNLDNSIQTFTLS